LFRGIYYFGNIGYCYENVSADVLIKVIYVNRREMIVIGCKKISLGINKK